MEYWWNFGMEWNTENLEYYSNIWSVFRNTIRILEKRRYSEIPGKMVLEQYSGILKYCQTKKEGKATVTSFGLYFKRYHKYAMYQRNGLSKV